ncbi:hypothetical protein HYV84_00080 [Candidatus Woesearchaeota archaeon]|nr:hypothetical protein [Candidatus Woesearchaeota archaeon]
MRKMIKKWKKLRFRSKLGLIGFLIGILHNPLLFFIQNTDSFLIKLFDKEYSIFCRLLTLEWGEPCGVVYFFAGIILFPSILGIFGTLVGFTIEKISSNGNEK